MVIIKEVNGKIIMITQYNEKNDGVSISITNKFFDVVRANVNFVNENNHKRTNKNCTCYNRFSIMHIYIQ